MSEKCQHATSRMRVTQKKKPPEGGSQFKSGESDQAAINAGFDFRR
jgi:hypothetical protein